MRRVSRDWPKLGEAMAFLGVQPPRVPKEAPQATLDELLEEWKATVLKKAYRKRARETHPDTGGDEEEFKRVESAYREICQYAKLAPPRPKPSSDFRFHTSNPFFTGGVRFRPETPNTRVHPSGFTRTGSHDHFADRVKAKAEKTRQDLESGQSVLTKCNRCDTPRHQRANFCHECGANYDEMTQEAIDGLADAMNNMADHLDAIGHSFAGFADAFNRRNDK